MRPLDLCKMTILCVENNPVMSKHIHEILSKRYPQHTIVMSEDCFTALHHIKNHAPDIYIISLDIPKEDRLFILSVICEMKLSRQCIATSDCLDDIRMANYVESGIRYFIAKPIEPETLFVKIDDLMQFRFLCKFTTAKTVEMAIRH